MSKSKTQIKLARIMTSNLRQTKLIFLIVATISVLCLFYTYNWNKYFYKISGEIAHVKYVSFKTPNRTTRSVYNVITSGSGYLLKNKNITMKFNKPMVTYNQGTKGFSVTENSVVLVDNSANDIKWQRNSNNEAELYGDIKYTDERTDSENTIITLGKDKHTEQTTRIDSKDVRIENDDNKKNNDLENDKRLDNLKKEFTERDDKTVDYTETTSDAESDELKLNTVPDVHELDNIKTNVEVPNTFSPTNKLGKQIEDDITNTNTNAENVAAVPEDLKRTKSQWISKAKKKKKGKDESDIHHSVPEVKPLPSRDTDAFQRVRNHLKQIGFVGNKINPIALSSDAKEALSGTGSDRPDVCKSCFKNNFEKLINEPMLCNGNVDLLILITSTAVNSDKRESIRKTWGSVCKEGKSNIRCVFVFGTKFNEQENQFLQQESKNHNDIIQFNFYDTYANLTYKTLSSIQWSHDFCPQAKYIMKTDDDMYVNTNLLPLLIKRAPDTEFIGGMCWGPSSPHRDSSSKWYVSFVQYKHSLFPSMCSGTGYVMSRDVADGILRQSPNVPFFYLEDVYVAICVKKLNIKPILVSGFKNTMVDFEPCLFRNRYITVHGFSGLSLEVYWKQIQMCPLDDLTPSMVYSGYAV